MSRARKLLLESSRLLGIKTNTNEEDVDIDDITPKNNKKLNLNSDEQTDEEPENNEEPDDENNDQTNEDENDLASEEKIEEVVVSTLQEFNPIACEVEKTEENMFIDISFDNGQDLTIKLSTETSVPVLEITDVVIDGEEIKEVELPSSLMNDDGTLNITADNFPKQQVLDSVSKLVKKTEMEVQEAFRWSKDKLMESIQKPKKRIKVKSKKKK